MRAAAWTASAVSRSRPGRGVVQASSRSGGPRRSSSRRTTSASASTAACSGASTIGVSGRMHTPMHGWGASTRPHESHAQVVITSPGAGIGTAAQRRSRSRPQRFPLRLRRDRPGKPFDERATLGQRSLEFGQRGARRRVLVGTHQIEPPVDARAEAGLRVVDRAAPDADAHRDHAVEPLFVKRSEELAPLSRDHHQGLFAALKLRRGAPDARDVFLRFWVDGRRHFAIEEELLLPALARHVPPDHEAIVRVLVEHVDLRRRAADVEERAATASLRNWAIGCTRTSVMRKTSSSR